MMLVLASSKAGRGSSMGGQGRVLPVGGQPQVRSLGSSLRVRGGLSHGASDGPLDRDLVSGCFCC